MTPTPAPEADSAPRSARSRERVPASFGKVAALAAIVFVLGYGLDQLTKYIVVTRMELGEQIWVIPGVLKWYSIRNPGAAFSMGEGYTWVFTLFMAVVALGVLVFLPRVRSLLWALALGGLFAGTTGNLTDRLFQPPGKGLGHVVDFVSVGNFAIFNVADSLIVCSVIGIVLLLWTGVPVAGGPRLTEASEADELEEPADDAPGIVPEPGAPAEASDAASDDAASATEAQADQREEPKA